MSDGKRYGLSDSLLDAVRSVQAQEKNLETNEEKHRGALGVNQQKQTEEPIEEMSSKEKMKKGLYNGKMDPVGKADKDIDNDGDVDDSDEYLHKRRKAIKKSMAKEAAGSRKQDKQAGETAPVKQGDSDMHKCAKQVAHEEWGAGETIHGEHGGIYKEPKSLALTSGLFRLIQCSPKFIFDCFKLFTFVLYFARLSVFLFVFVCAHCATFA